MSRSNPTNTPTYHDKGVPEGEPPEKRSWHENPSLFNHWYEAYKLGYRPQKSKWPERDIDDDRFNLKEKE